MSIPAERTGHHGPKTFAGEPNADPSKRPTWFKETIDDIPEEGRELLENYSGISPQEVIPHVQRIRDRAFDIWSYACIGQLRFLNYNLAQLPYYDAVLHRLRHQGATFLDAGCCFGQILRFLVHREHIPARQLYGFDLEPAFVKFGHDLFRDGDTLDATLLSGDLLADDDDDDDDRTSSSTRQIHSLNGQMDIVHVSSVLHVWAWTDQLKATERLVSFTRPVPGSLVVGNQMGSLNAGEYPMPTGAGRNYRHDEASMRRFWAEVGARTGTRWKVDCGLHMSSAIVENRGASWADPGMRMIWFVAERL